jgi:hypothetical protein
LAEPARRAKNGGNQVRVMGGNDLRAKTNLATPNISELSEIT